MTTRAIGPAEERASATGDWLKLSAQLTKASDLLAGTDDRGKLTPGRRDIVVTIAPGAGHGSRACFVHGLAEIEIDGKYLEVDPDPKFLEPAKYWEDRNRIPATWGLLTHEVAHAVHTRWLRNANDWAQSYARTYPAKAMWVARILDAAQLLEEPRIEARQIGRRPWDDRFLRMSASTHLLGEISTDKLAARYAAMRVVTLVGGRKTAGIVTADEVSRLLTKASSILGPRDYLDALNLVDAVLDKDTGVSDSAWLDTSEIAHKPNGDPYEVIRRGMYSRAEEWLRILDRVKEPEPDKDRQELIMQIAEALAEEAAEKLRQEREERRRQQEQWWGKKPSKKSKKGKGKGNEEKGKDGEGDPDKGDKGESGHDGEDKRGDAKGEGGEGSGQSPEQGKMPGGPGGEESGESGGGGQPGGQDGAPGEGMPGEGQPGSETRDGDPSAAGSSAGPSAGGFNVREAMGQLTTKEREMVEILVEAARIGGEILKRGGWLPWTPMERATAFEPTWHDVTPEQKRRADSLRDRLLEWFLPERSAGQHDNELPPGRLNGRMAIKRQAQRAAGIPPTAEQWRHVTRKMVPTPPLRAGLIVDVSGSMRSMAPVSREIAYRFAQALGQLPDARFRGYLAGWGVAPWQSKPGKVPHYEYHHNQQNVNVAGQELMKSLALMKRGNARLLVVISDGNIFDAVYTDQKELSEMTAVMDKILNTGGHILWLSYKGRKMNEKEGEWRHDGREPFRRYRMVPGTLASISAPVDNVTYLEVSTEGNVEAAVRQAEDALIKVMKGAAGR